MCTLATPTSFALILAAGLAACSSGGNSGTDTTRTVSSDISVSIAPLIRTVPIGGTASFAAALQGVASNTELSWTLSCGSDDCGTVVAPGWTDSVIYAAPSTPQANRPGDRITITAALVIDPSKSASATVALAPAAITFSTRSFPAGLSPVALALADFNGDGVLDIAVADNGDAASGMLGGVSVLLGMGDGTFQQPLEFEAGPNPITIVVGDFNSDGWKDLLVGNGEDPSVSGQSNLLVFLGRGDGTFSTPIAVATGSVKRLCADGIAVGDFTNDRADALAVGDFNNDHIADVAVCDPGDAAAGDPGGISVLLGNGDGSFRAPVVIVSGDGPVGVVAQDLNRDGNLDLAVADHSISADALRRGLRIALGHGNGSFELSSSSGTYDGPVPIKSITTGDLNSDRSADLILGTTWVTKSILPGNVMFGNQIEVLPGDGSGSFGRQIDTVIDGWQYHAGDFKPNSVRVADFDGDGIPDVAELDDGAFGVIRGSGDGNFTGTKLFDEPSRSEWLQGRLRFSVGSNPAALAVGDLNGDGKPDIVTVNLGSHDVTVLLNGQ
jgi:hypothetical protein